MALKCLSRNPVLAPHASPDIPRATREANLTPIALTYIATERTGNSGIRPLNETPTHDPETLTTPMDKPDSPRDLMAPDTEPTDAELHTVMREALELAMERKKRSDDWMREQLTDTVKSIRDTYQAAHR